MNFLKIRIPLRLQITFLLAFFVLAVAVVSFRVTFSVFESDKLGSVRDIQTLQITDLSREINDRVGRSRTQLREAALQLLDASRGEPQIEEGTWSWITVRGKSWKAPGSTESPPAAGAESNLEASFRFVDDPSDKNFVIVEEPIKIQEAGVAQTLLAKGRIAKAVLFGDKSRLNQGPIKGLLLEASDLVRNSPRADADIIKQVVLGDDTAKKTFASFFMTLDQNDRSLMLQPTQPISRKFVDRAGNEILVSWATVPVLNSNMQLSAISFSDLYSILEGYRRTRYTLMYWSFVMLGLGVIAATYLGGKLSQPIENMVEATRLLETGDFSVRVHNDRFDEIGDLSQAFNHMGEALDQRERELANAQNALIQNEKMAALGTLSAGIAHEVKNPLAGILGHADISAQQIKKMPADVQGILMKHIETIQKETKRCRGIIDNLMRFSRKEDSTEKSKYDPIDVETVAWEAIMLMEHPLNMAKVRVDKEFDPDAKLVLGNGNQIEQVILNMLQNAGHAMPDGGSVKVSTHYFSDPQSAPVGDFVAYAHPEFAGPFVRVSVADTGSGMTDEVMRKIFEPFFTTKPRGMGTGLGLSVTMTILGDHRARVSLNSSPGNGTAFLIDFMASGDRTPEIYAQLEELKLKKSGGPRLATDVGVAPPLTDAPIASESPGESGQSVMSESSFQEESGTQTQIARPKLNTETASGAEVSKRFTLRKPQVKKT